jgi:hypothetical protein
MLDEPTSELQSTNGGIRLWTIWMSLRMPPQRSDLCDLV